MIKIALLQSRNILSFEGGRTERTGVLVLHERADGLWNAWPQGSNTASSCGSNAQRQTVRAGFRAPEGQLARGHPRQTTHRTGRDDVLRRDLLVKPACPVVVITCVRYLGPPGPSPSQILGTFSRISETFLAVREGGVPRGSSRTLGDPPWGLSLSLPRKPSENLEKVPRIWEVEDPGGPR